MTRKSSSYPLPEMTETLSQLEGFGAIIVGALYFVLIAMAIIWVVHKLVTRFLFPRLANKRFAFVLLGSLYALVVVTTALLIMERLGFDTSVIGRVSLLSVIALSALIFVIAPHLPSIPVKIGDMVEIGGMTGKIASIMPLFVRIQAFDGRTVFVPTAKVWSSQFTNYHFTPTRRIELGLKVSTDNDLEQALSLLVEIMSGDERVETDPAPLARINAISADGADVVGLCWVANADFLATRSALYQRVVEAVQDNEELALAREQRSVLISGELSHSGS